MSLVIFDLDGTLIDSVPDLAAALNGVFAEEGQAAFSLPEVTSFVGHGLASLVARAMAARGLAKERHPELAARVLARYEADSTSRTRIYPGVIAALEALAGEGFRLGLCTNKPEAAALGILDRLDLSRHFAAVIGGRPGRLKPDPAPLFDVVAALGGGPAVMVGDSEVDAETAHAAGIPFLLFTEGYRRSSIAALAPQASFADYARLPGLVREALAAGLGAAG